MFCRLWARNEVSHLLVVTAWRQSQLRDQGRIIQLANSAVAQGRYWVKGCLQISNIPECSVCVSIFMGREAPRFLIMELEMKDAHLKMFWRLWARNEVSHLLVVTAWRQSQLRDQGRIIQLANWAVAQGRYWSKAVYKFNILI
ncbi:hypothetical protein AVEN_189440-1 [Araneus ventricosus]|uniref:Uncharacterized protein n=1 Tax=Araneus ventricosus TaxID=182803 RepID=A0A4Y2P595_ARAVE|nr:hypothetical protein AVEN_189440-1 [Araneus ventricosus]